MGDVDKERDAVQRSMGTALALLCDPKRVGVSESWVAVYGVKINRCTYRADSARASAVGGAGLRRRCAAALGRDDGCCDRTWAYRGDTVDSHGGLYRVGIGRGPACEQYVLLTVSCVLDIARMTKMRAAGAICGGLVR